MAQSNESEQELSSINYPIHRAKFGRPPRSSNSRKHFRSQIEDGSAVPQNRHNRRVPGTAGEPVERARQRGASSVGTVSVQAPDQRRVVCGREARLVQRVPNRLPQVRLGSVQSAAQREAVLPDRREHRRVSHRHPAYRQSAGFQQGDLERGTGHHFGDAVHAAQSGHEGHFEDPAE